MNMLQRYHQAGSTNGLVEIQDTDPHQDDTFDLDEAIPSLAESKTPALAK